MKSEARNSNFETISNDQSSKRGNTNVWIIRNLKIWICFGFRYSDFEFVGPLFSVGILQDEGDGKALSFFDGLPKGAH